MEKFILLKGYPATWLPESVFDRLGELHEITCLGDRYRRFYDPSNGWIYDGARYAEIIRLSPTEDLLIRGQGDDDTR